MEWNYNFEIDDNEEFEDAFKEDTVTSGTVFLIDCGQNLFKKEVSSGENQNKISWFEAIIKCCLSVVKNKAMTADKDHVSVIFYRVINENDKIMKTVHIFQTLDQPGVTEIKALSKLQFISMDKFDETYKFAEEASLYHALWCCQSLFIKCKTALESKQIIMFTFDDDPCAGNETVKKTLLVKAQDLKQNNIHLEIIPLANSDFRDDKFYALLLEANTSGKNSDISITNPVTKMEQLMTRIRHKQHRKRTTAKISWFLGNKSLAISVGVYNLVRKIPPLPYVLLDSKSNIEVDKKSAKISQDSVSEISTESDRSYYVNILGKSIYFQKEETSKFRSLIEQGIHLLGFKPLKYLLPHYQIRAPQFIYPDDAAIKGSVRIFAALLKRCIERELFALCVYAPRKSSQLHYIALLPQKQKLNNDLVQVQPAGFAVIFLPFGDDIRSLDIPLCDDVSDTDKEISLQLIKSLCVEYEPETILNPARQKQLACIEALALEQDAPEPTEDNTVMDNLEINKHCGHILENYKEHFKLSFQTASSTANRSSKPTVEIDLKSLYKFDKLNSATVAQLKEEAIKLKIKMSGSKKADIIKSICSHFDSMK